MGLQGRRPNEKDVAVCENAVVYEHAGKFFVRRASAPAVHGPAGTLVRKYDNRDQSSFPEAERTFAERRAQRPAATNALAVFVGSSITNLIHELLSRQTQNLPSRIETNHLCFFNTLWYINVSLR